MQQKKLSQAEKDVIGQQGQHISTSLVAALADSGFSPQATCVGLTLATASMVATLIEVDPRSDDEAWVAQRKEEYINALRSAIERYSSRAAAVTPEMIAEAKRRFDSAGSFSNLQTEIENGRPIKLSNPFVGN